MTDAVQNQFVAGPQNDRPIRAASRAIDTEHKKKKLLEDYAEEFLPKHFEWEIRLSRCPL